MSRDYKTRSNVPRRKTKSSGSTLIGVFVGLVIGVLIAFGVVWYLNKTPVPFLKSGKSVERTPESRVGVEPDSVAPLVLPGKPGDKAPVPPERPRFEFYKILPGGGEASPAVVTQPDQQPKSGGDSIFLQAGAFQSPADADNLKAKLALMGFEASVQQVTVPDRGVWHRVRLGPYQNQAELGQVRNQLLEAGIQAAVVKTKGSAAN